MKRTSNTARPRDDDRLWTEAVRDVAPLRRSRSANWEPPGPTVAPDPAGVEQDRASSPRVPALDRFADIDRASAERLKRGLHRIEARLDLHGMTQAQAHRALTAFIGASRDASRRCVLVITGRGLGQSGPGILKSSVPRWLEEPELRPHILAIAPAQPHHGGPGATYLLLRRRR